MDNVPTDETQAAEWLQNLFREKDKIIDSFLTTGSFFKTSGIKETAYKYYPRRLCSLVNFALWATFSISLIMYYIISSLVLHNWIGLSIVVGILVICKCILFLKRELILFTLSAFFFSVYIFMVKAINMSKISKASSYGADIKSSTK